MIVKINGNKIWNFRYTFNQKRRLTSFRSYPIEKNKEAKQEQLKDTQGMFLNVVKEWLELESHKVKSNTHQNKVRVFENDINPFLKDKHINEVTKDDILKIIKTKEIQAPNVATRIFTFLRALFNYAIFKGYLSKNIFSNSKDEIRFYLQKQEAKHFAKVTDEKILKELIEDIYNYRGMHSIRNALKFVLHIPLRADNLCNLKWQYINFKDRVLTIPRAEMKIKDKNLQDFKMPLSDEIINILNEQKTFTGYQSYVFLDTNNKNSINTESPNGALKRMGFNDERKGKKQRLHGFRVHLEV